MRTNQMANYLLVAAGIASIGLIAGVKLGTLLPLALLLACPLMMVFMMRGMGGMHGQGEDHTGHGGEHATWTVGPPAGDPR